MDLDQLFSIIQNRKHSLVKNSYVASLFTAGRNRIIQKVGEEAVELVIAAKNGQKKEVIAETADLWFHSLVLLALFNIKPEDILNELKRRAGGGSS